MHEVNDHMCQKRKTEGGSLGQSALLSYLASVYLSKLSQSAVKNLSQFLLMNLCLFVQ